MDLRQTASDQAGVFSRAQARAAGWSAYRIRRSVATGSWIELFGGRVFRAAQTPMTPRAWAHAALLATGNRSALAGPTAAAVLGIAVTLPQPTVIVPPTSRREPSGITVIRDVLDDSDLLVFEEWTVTHKSRTVVDTLRLVPERTGRAFLDRALQLRWITFEELVRRTQLLTGRRGVPRLRRHISIAALGVRSDAERVLQRLLTQAGLTGWVPDHAVADVGIFDFAFPRERLALEVDGRAWHSTGDRFQRDRTKQNAAVARGWTVLRFTWEDLVDRPADVIAAIERTLVRLRSAS